VDINNNAELRQAVDETIKESGYKKSWIADQLGISRQGFSNLLNKSNFSLDDANKILTVINKKTVTKINEK
jgi:predicted XRE-type DNA-binding protein